MGFLQPIIERAMAAGGPRTAMEAFARFAAGDANFERLDPQLRERMLGNGETFFGIEFGAFESYRPGDATLAAVNRTVQVMVGTESAPFFGEASQWLAEHLNIKVVAMPGAHTPYFDRPQEMAEAIRPFLRRVSTGL